MESVLRTHPHLRPSDSHAASRLGSLNVFPCRLFPQLFLIRPSSVLPTQTLSLRHLCLLRPPAYPALWLVVWPLIPPMYFMFLSSPWTPFLISCSQVSPKCTPHAATVLGTPLSPHSMHAYMHACGFCLFSLQDLFVQHSYLGPLFLCQICIYFYFFKLIFLQSTLFLYF